MLNIKASDAALETFNDIKLGKKTAFIIFEIAGSDINVESQVLKEEVDKDYVETYIKAIKKSGMHSKRHTTWCYILFGFIFFCNFYFDHHFFLLHACKPC